MTTFLGLDLGTSSVKAIILDEVETVLAAVSVPVPSPTHPMPLASEQPVESWWTAVATALGQLAADHAPAMARVAGIGLSGQKHGLCAARRGGTAPVRPAMLWNDGRAADECLSPRRGSSGSRAAPWCAADGGADGAQAALAR